MSKVFAVEVRRGKELIFRHSVSSVRLPGLDGPVTIMTGHRPGDVEIDVGVIRLVSFDGRSICLAVDGGHAQVRRNGVVIESSHVLLPEDIDEAEARRDYDYATEILTAPETPTARLGAAKHAQSWSAARIEVLICHNTQERPASKSRPIALGDHLSEDTVIMDLAGRDKWAVIEELVDRLVAAGSLSKRRRDRALESVLSREKMMSTALGAKIAIPHGSCKGVKGVAIALGRSIEGVDFNALDHEPVHLVILAVIKPATFKLYVQTLGGIARLFRDGSLLQALLAETSPEGILHRIRDAERDMLVF